MTIAHRSGLLRALVAVDLGMLLVFGHQAIAGDDDLRAISGAVAGAALVLLATAAVQLAAERRTRPGTPRSKG